MALTPEQVQLRDCLEKIILEALRPRLELFIENDLTEKRLTTNLDEAAPAITRFRYSDGTMLAETLRSCWNSKVELNLPVRSQESLLMSCSYRLREASEVLHYKKR